MINELLNFEVYRTEDKTVSKYIHEDGSETAIKIIKSVQSILNPLTKQIETHYSDRNKYSIFISSSVGCYMKCKFCHLTLKNSEYKKISSLQVLNNLKEAILDMVNFNPDIKNKYVKLSWMGMGDAINKPEMVYEVTIELLNWIFENNFAKGLDGVDLSTVMPKLKNDNWIELFHKLENDLHKYNINPIYNMDNIQFTNIAPNTGFYSHKNIFRLFYSVESAIQEKRENVVPNAMSLIEAANLLNKYSQENKYPVILHHLIVGDLNDSEEELIHLVDFVNNNFKNSELRILRYNFCAKSNYRESLKFTEQIRYLSDKINFLKVQVSPGNEVSAACGQFIVKDFIRIKKNN